MQNFICSTLFIYIIQVKNRLFYMEKKQCNLNDFNHQMKKAILLLYFILFINYSSIASPINLETAKKVAMNFLKNKTDSIKLKNATSIELIYVSRDKEVVYFYVFNVNPIGFIVISGDDRALPVLSYSDESSYDTSKINKSADQWFEGYKNQIKYSIENNIQATDEIQKKWYELNRMTTHCPYM